MDKEFLIEFKKLRKHHFKVFASFLISIKEIFKRKKKK